MSVLRQRLQAEYQNLLAESDLLEETIAELQAWNNLTQKELDQKMLNRKEGLTQLEVNVTKLRDEVNDLKSSIKIRTKLQSLDGGCGSTIIASIPTDKFRYHSK